MPDATSLPLHNGEQGNLVGRSTSRASSASSRSDHEREAAMRKLDQDLDACLMKVLNRFSAKDEEELKPVSKPKLVFDSNDGPRIAAQESVVTSATCETVVEYPSSKEMDGTETNQTDKTSGTETTSTSRRLRQTVKSAAVATATTTLADVKFIGQVVIRLIPAMIICFFVGYFSGNLMYMAGQTLITEAREPARSAWAAKHSWSKQRDLELNIFKDGLDDILMNSTYVQIYDRVHRVKSEEPDAPKFQDMWIIIYYARMGIQALLAFGAPWVIFWIVAGWRRVWKYVLLWYGPIFLAVVGYCIVAAWWNLNMTESMNSTYGQNIGAFILAVIQVFVAIPWVAKRLGMQHPFKTIVIPYLLLNVSLLGLKYIIPFIVIDRLENDYFKVLFRLTAFPATQELFIAAARMCARLIPYEKRNTRTRGSQGSDETLDGESDHCDIRAEDKPFLILPQVALFSYFGRFILMGLTDKYAMWAANLGLMLLEICSRAFIVQRDKLYLGRVVLRSPEKMKDWWGTNARGMQKLRCSMIYGHSCTEYLMMASASAYYLGAGISTDLEAHWYNYFVQVGSELVTDSISLYIEIVRHKMPVQRHWNTRHPHWAAFYAFFIFSINVIIVAHGGMYYCALRDPRQVPRKPILYYDSRDPVVVTFCGPDK